VKTRKKYHPGRSYVAEVEYYSVIGNTLSLHIRLESISQVIQKPSSPSSEVSWSELKDFENSPASHRSILLADSTHEKNVPWKPTSVS
jgi:hypothetical protein